MRFTISLVENQRSRGREMVYSVPRKAFDGMADRVFPRNCLRVQVVVHIEHRAFDITDAPQLLLGYIGVQHGFGAGKDHRVRMI